MQTCDPNTRDSIAQSVPRAREGAAGFSPAVPKLPGVTGELGYLAPMSARPFSYMYPPPAGSPWHNGEFLQIATRIDDARAMVPTSSIETEGFALWLAPTAVTDFEDGDNIRRRYYPEAAELAKAVTGATDACVFDHTVRRREKGRPMLGFGRAAGGERPGAVGRVHTDYSEASARMRFQILSLNRQIRADAPRFAIVNLWRSIRGAVLDTPLALCDARTVSVQDLIAGDLFYRDRIGERYLVCPSPRHRWAYFSSMDFDEVLVFKQYDSRINGVARFTPHAAFDLPDIPTDTPLRESIEVRCLVTFG